MTKKFRLSFLLALAALPAACSERTPTDVSANRLQGPQFSVGGSISIPVPDTNAAVPKMLVGYLPSEKWAVLHVEGEITLSRNPSVDLCAPPDWEPPFVGHGVGPMGIAGRIDLLRVYGYHNGGTGLLFSFDGDSSAMTSRVLYNRFAEPEPIEVMRTGMYNYYLDCNGTKHAFYRMSGSQTATIELLPDPEVTATKTMISAMDTVQFILSNKPEGMNVLWVYYPSDTLSTPKMNPSYSYIQQCNYQLSCSVPLIHSGRMYAVIAGVANYASPIVWVGKSASQLTLACTPSIVLLGARPDCAAGSSTGDSISVQAWRLISQTTGTQFVICGTINLCFPTINEDSYVSVTAVVGGVEQTKTVPVGIATAEDPGNCAQAWQYRGFQTEQECLRINAVLDSMVVGSDSEECLLTALSAQVRAQSGNVFLWKQLFSIARIEEGRVYLTYVLFPPYNDSDKLIANELFHEEYHVRTGETHDPDDPDPTDDRIYQFGNTCATEVYDV